MKEDMLRLGEGSRLSRAVRLSWQQGKHQDRGETVAAKSNVHALALKPVLDELRAAGITSHSGLARELNRRGLRGVHGSEFSGQTVKRILARLDGLEASSPPPQP